MPFAEVSRHLRTCRGPGEAQRPLLAEMGPPCLNPAPVEGQVGGRHSLAPSGLCPGTKFIMGPCGLQVCGKQTGLTDLKIIRNRLSEHFFFLMNYGEKSVEAPGCEVGGLFTRVLSLSASQHPPARLPLHSHPIAFR